MAEIDQAETPQEPIASALRTRGNVQDITALIASESNAQGDEIEKRRAEGDADLGSETPPPVPAHETPPEVEEQAETPAAPTSFKELAESAGIELADLYELTIGFGDGTGQDEPVKLGAIKDAYQKGLEIETKSADLETKKRAFENAQIVANEAIELQLNELQLTPQQVEARANQVAGNKLREQQKLFEVMPELAADVELRKQTHRDIVDLLGPYGISEVAVDSLSNHKYYKFLIDAVNAFGLIDQADADAKRLRKVGTGKGITRKTNGKGERQTEAQTLVTKAKASGMRGDQIAAISALMGN